MIHVSLGAKFAAPCLGWQSFTYVFCWLRPRRVHVITSLVDSSWLANLLDISRGHMPKLITTVQIIISGFNLAGLMPNVKYPVS